MRRNCGAPAENALVKPIYSLDNTTNRGQTEITLFKQAMFLPAMFRQDENPIWILASGSDLIDAN
jgi:hypothetical protein